MDSPFCYLTTTGRRTGRAHTIEIWFVAVGRTVYLMAGGRDGADWVRNLMADPEATLQVGSESWAARGRLVEEGTPEDAEARRLMLAKYSTPGTGDLESWGRSALVVAIDVPGWSESPA
ncbi:MAG TPA: nitroreductase family deazaflavin-dependent oxidoreductase [Acidimicrobiia bacterium]|nr:nitroreductase family deazaflavin-dependent oxidoreductase [Acidimicrobiia bacterium]